MSQGQVIIKLAGLNVRESQNLNLGIFGQSTTFSDKKKSHQIEVRCQSKDNNDPRDTVKLAKGALNFEEDIHQMSLMKSDDNGNKSSRQVIPLATSSRKLINKNTIDEYKDKK